MDRQLPTHHTGSTTLKPLYYLCLKEYEHLFMIYEVWEWIDYPIYAMPPVMSHWPCGYYYQIPCDAKLFTDMCLQLHLYFARY